MRILKINKSEKAFVIRPEPSSIALNSVLIGCFPNGDTQHFLTSSSWESRNVFPHITDINNEHGATLILIPVKYGFWVEFICNTSLLCETSPPSPLCHYLAWISQYKKKIPILIISWRIIKRTLIKCGKYQQWSLPGPHHQKMKCSTPKQQGLKGSLPPLGIPLLAYLLCKQI